MVLKQIFCTVKTSNFNSTVATEKGCYCKCVCVVGGRAAPLHQVLPVVFKNGSRCLSRDPFFLKKKFRPQQQR